MLRSFLIIFVIGLFACSPKVQNKDLPPTDSINKPNLDEITTLAQPEATSSRMKLEWKGEVPTSEVNLVIKDYIEIGDKLNDGQLKAVGIKLYNKLYKEGASWQEHFDNLPFMALYRKTALPEVKKEIKRIDSELNKSLTLAKTLTTQSRNKVKWPTKATFDQSLHLLELVLTDLEVKYQENDFYPEFKTELITQFKSEKTNNLLYLKSFSENIKSQINLSFLISEIKKLAQEYSYQFDTETAALLQKSVNLGVKIDSISDSRSALTALIEVWLFLDSSDREKEIKPISLDLFNFLNSRTEEEIRCLVDSRCGGLWDSLVKTLFILPKIDAFGPQNIQKKLNQRSYAIATQVLDQKFYAVISNIHKRINSMLDKGILKGKQRLLEINANTLKYVDTKLLDWVSNNVADNTALYNTILWPNIKISRNNSNVLIFTSINRDNSVTKETIGTSFQVANVLLNKANLDELSARKLLLEQINILFSFGGIASEFPDKNKYQTGLVRNLQSPLAEFNLTKAISSTDSYSLEDRFVLDDVLHRNKNVSSYKLSARSTAHFILGLAEMVDYLKDWRENNYDTLLGQVKPSELFQSEPTANEESVFSKTKFFGYAAGHLANILSNFNKPTTSIALIDGNSKLTWSNELANASSSAFLYSIFVNVENNFKSETMNIEDMTLLIQVLARLIDAVQGIEKTHFPEFTKPLTDLKGKSVVQVINENIQSVSKAFIPLGNTIATKMKKLTGENEAGLIFNQINITNFQNNSAKYYLSDQLKAMDAMILVYEKTKIDSYLWAALEIFNYLQKFYNPKTNYYQFNDEVATVPNTLTLLKTLIHIKPYLQKNEQVIVEERIRFLRSALLSIK